MYKLMWEFKSRVRLFPYFGKSKFKPVLVKDSMLIIDENKLNEHINTLKQGKYKYCFTRVFPKWLELNY